MVIEQDGFTFSFVEGNEGTRGRLSFQKMLDTPRFARRNFMQLKFRSLTKSYCSECFFVLTLEKWLIYERSCDLTPTCICVNLSEFEQKWRSWCATCKPRTALSQEWFANSVWMDHRTVLNPLLSFSSIDSAKVKWMLD